MGVLYISHNPLIFLTTSAFTLFNSTGGKVYCVLMNETSQSLYCVV